MNNPVNVTDVAKRLAGKFSPSGALSSPTAVKLNRGYRQAVEDLLPTMLEMAFFCHHKTSCGYWSQDACTCGLTALKVRFNELLKG